MLDITDASFQREVLDSTDLVLVDFNAEWCGPCKAISPIIDKIANQYSGQLKVVRIDVDQNPLTCDQYNVRGIPTLMFFSNGKIAQTIVGFAGNDEIEQTIEGLLKENVF